MADEGQEWRQVPLNIFVRQKKLMKCYIHNLAIATLGYVHISLKLLIIELKDAQEQGKAEASDLSQVLHAPHYVSDSGVKTKPYTEVEKKAPDSVTYLCVS